VQIYLLQDGEKSGPFSVFEVAEEVRSGRATGDTLGWHQGSDGWIRLEDLPAASTIFVEPPPRRELVEAEDLAARRARLAPERLRSSVRLWARLIDLFFLEWIILMVVLGSGMTTVTDLLTKTHLEMQLLPAALLVVVEAFLIRSFGTTPGKWLLRVQVVMDDGGLLSLKTSFRRALTVWWRGVGFWLVPLNIFMMALSQATLLSTGKTPWDHACGTRLEYGKLDTNRILLIIAIMIVLLLAMNFAFGEQLLGALEEAKKKA
jgi:uncharacterized RDD family membrane protein YckC